MIQINPLSTQSSIFKRKNLRGPNKLKCLRQYLFLVFSSWATIDDWKFDGDRIEPPTWLGRCQREPLMRALADRAVGICWLRGSCSNWQVIDMSNFFFKNELNEYFINSFTTNFAYVFHGNSNSLIIFVNS